MYNKGIILNLLRVNLITAGSVLLTDNPVSLKWENPEPISTVKIIEWRKLVDYIGISIEADQSRMG